MKRKLVHKKSGCVKIARRNGDRLAFSIDGREIGWIEFSGMPESKRVRVACFFDAEVRITRPDRNSEDAARS